MKEPTYRQTLVHAWNVVWENKILWILGLLSVFLGQLGFSDVFGKIWSMFDNSLASGGFALVPLLKLNLTGGVWSALGLVWLSVICVAVVFLVIFLAAASQGSLIAYAADWFKNGKHQTLAKPWRKSIKHFWSILLVNVVRQVLLFLLLLGFVLIADYFFVSRTPLEGFVFAASAVLVLIASLVFSALCIYTLCYVVLDGKGVLESVKKAWALFSDHLLVSLEVGLLLMLMNFFLVLVIAVGSFFAFLPSVLIWVAAGFTNLVVLAAIGLILGIFLLLLFIALVAGFFNAFTISAWVFLFMRMHKEGLSSRAIHFFKHIFSK
ncbi:MAG: hypothetical protein A2534_00625 [Candidatus Magasanikbacteria bacterium RIFOXYD2_FULL_39_9]|uniref:Glycerophosphoryl diester phosphodiesterase membrane domain-containing protein n=1 Tax=Candidatus Magasanikbacteria bacterium RIFOXYD1_FULL_40_23 TaxID=1798705 RepID=A0A1F6P9V3_9BACT|nr:MAG: hypothetical protein A2563_03620 [Candidatus Magasanikbacteria bacterium RIFOXYD1_FULL_40_23]OGH93026.1 MAG: hypothetical protein A2534_00625 [Candidatus Magasanikbacteria bacterium RIFOXYD2_FULL_39_9]